jgi:CelD/BcsL family acetyltransferase involved in cellulose biosynthesis
MLSAETITDPGRLSRLAGDWQALADSLENVSPFQLPGWQITWWQHFGSGELRSLAFWEGTRLAGLVPAFCHEWNGRRQLTLLGSGISDYLEPLLTSPAILPLLASKLLDDPDWEICVWQDLSAQTPLRELPGLRLTIEEDTPCSAIPLGPASFEDFWSQRGPDLRRNIKRYRAKAEAQGGPAQFDVSPLQPQLLEILIALHGKRWQHQGESGMVEANRSAQFLRDVTACPGWHTFTLLWQGDIVAITAGFLRGPVVYSYLSAFDPRYEILGFGRYLLYRSLQWAWANGYTSWNFLRGEEAYKASWGAVPESKSRLFITRS